MKLMRNIAIAVVLALIVLVGVVSVAFDANKFSPLITQAARERGFAVQISSIKLAFWPDLGLALEQISADSIEHRGPEPLLAVAHATLSIPIKPLLSGQLQVKEVSISNGVVNLWKNKSGDNNWTPPIDASAQQNSQSSSAGRAVAIKKIKLDDVVFSWQEDKQQPLVMNIKQAEVQQSVANVYLIATTGKIINAHAKAPALAFTLDQELKQADAGWQLINGKGKLGPVDGPQLLINYQADVDAEFTKTTGAFAIESFNPSSYLTLLNAEMADKSRLKSVAVHADFSWQSQALEFTKGVLVLDNVPINWQLSQNSERWQLAVKAPKINVDAYLPSNTNEKNIPASGMQSADIDLTGLPQADLSLQIEELIYAKQSIADVNLKAAINQKQITLSPVSARMYSGAVNGRAEINLAAKSVQLIAQADATGISIDPLWKQFNPQAQFQLTGNVNAKTQWQSTAPSLMALTKHLNGQIQYQGDSVRIAPLNITQQYCQIVNQATQWKKDDNNDWPEFTQLRDLTGDIAISPTQIELTRLHSRVDKLQLDGTGTLERDTGKFSMQLPITLVQMGDVSDTANGCTIGSEFWVNRRLSLLTCKGQLATLDPKRDCGINREGAADILKQYALYKIKKGEGINVDHIKEKAAEKKAELKEKLNSTLDPEQVEKLEGKLKGLFKRDK